MSEFFTLEPAPRPRPRPQSDEDNLYGEGWNAHRTGKGCTLRWLTNHPDAQLVSAEATAAITEADFERLRQNPGTSHEIIRKYEPASATD
ncbi:MAG: hypothetical protein ACRDG7_07880 [Candidatus Limnocylindria bacterium]